MVRDDIIAFPVCEGWEASRQRVVSWGVDGLNRAAMTAIRALPGKARRLTFMTGAL